MRAPASKIAQVLLVLCPALTMVAVVFGTTFATGQFAVAHPDGFTRSAAQVVRVALDGTTAPAVHRAAMADGMPGATSVALTLDVPMAYDCPFPCDRDEGAFTHLRNFANDHSLANDRFWLDFNPELGFSDQCLAEVRNSSWSTEAADSTAVTDSYGLLTQDHSVEHFALGDEPGHHVRLQVNPARGGDRNLCHPLATIATGFAGRSRRNGGESESTEHS